jgi:PKD domain
MKSGKFAAAALATSAAFLCAQPAAALERSDTTFKVFQFPADQMPRIDGDGLDWSMVPNSYVIGTNQLTDTDGKHPAPDAKTLDIKVKVGWVKGLNRLYFLYEAYDDYWDFSLPGLKNDTFEIMVDGDASGGPLIDVAHQDVYKPEIVGAGRAKIDPRIPNSEMHWASHGVHAQNYHIFTPAVDKDWTMAWSSASWIKQFPYANASTKFNFKPGQSGKLTLEFYVTPYDYAGPEGPQRAVESVLTENKIIGLGFIIIDYDDVAKRERAGFWNLSHTHTAFGDASALPAFKLMPLEDSVRKKPLDAQYSFKVVDMDRRVVAFKDETAGQVTSWKWDFGDGATSAEQHPIHAYERAGNFVTILDVEGPAGKSRRSKVWDVQLK